MKLSDHIAVGAVLLSRSRGREGLLPLMVDAICREWNEGEPSALLELAWERERQGCTAVGMGVCIPHLRSPALSDLRIAVALDAEGTGFPSPDGCPVRLVFLLASPPAKAGAHVKALALVARLDGSAVDDLVSAKDAEDFLRRLRAWEERPGPRG